MFPCQSLALKRNSKNRSFLNQTKSLVDLKPYYKFDIILFDLCNVLRSLEEQYFQAIFQYSIFDNMPYYVLYGNIPLRPTSWRSFTAVFKRNHISLEVHSWTLTNELHFILMFCGSSPKSYGLCKWVQSIKVFKMCPPKVSLYSEIRLE